MLGFNNSCGGPVSWLWSEVWRCSPRVSPQCVPTTESSNTEEMTDCDQCNTKFTILKRKRICGGCGLTYCGSCIRREVGGTRHCNKCHVLSLWPLDRAQVAALRVKDLRHFLHSQHINSNSCTEKRELIDLVTRHICNKHPEYRSNNSSSSYSSPPRRPPVSTVTRDDGIRVRPTSTISDHDNNSMDSIRVRPMDSIRVRPGPLDSIRVRPGRPLSPDSGDYDPEMDLGIRVFATGSISDHNRRPNSTSPISTEECSESIEEDCLRCPSEDGTSCCSLDSCHNGASSQPRNCHCPHRTDNSSHCSIENINMANEGQDHVPQTSNLRDNNKLNSFAQDPTSDSLHNEGPGSQDSGAPDTASVQGNNSEVPTQTNSANSDSTASNSNLYPTLPVLEEDTQPTTTSTPSSSTFPSETPSPEAEKQFGPGIVSLDELKNEDDIRRLSVRQCKEILALHRVNLSGVREKSELINKVNILWKDYQNSHQDVDKLPEELVCKICMDSAIDCVFLECGHMVACTPCGKQMAECPVCRQYVVRVVRTFRA